MFLLLFHVFGDVIGLRDYAGSCATDCPSQCHGATAALSPLCCEDTEAQHPVTRDAPGMRTSVLPELLGTTPGSFQIFEGCFKYLGQVPSRFFPFLWQQSPGVPSPPLPHCSGKHPGAECAA